MRKLNLNLDEIQVDSFATSEMTDRTGTVRGQDETEVARPTPCLSCRQTCQDTCACPDPTASCDIFCNVSGNTSCNEPCPSCMPAYCQPGFVTEAVSCQYC